MYKKMAILLGLFAIGIVACVSLSPDKSSRNPAQTKHENSDCQDITPLSNEEFTWPIVRDRILNQPDIFNSVDKALCLLPRDFVNRNVAMMVNSFSLQKSSLSDPRAIVFPKETTNLTKEMLFISYNSAGFPGGSALEFVRYNPQAPIRNQIEMAEIEFTDKVTVHQGTPMRCQKCHGIEPQFLWSERDFWPAAAAGESIYRTQEEYSRFIKGLESNRRLGGLNHIDQFGVMRGRLSSLNFLATTINSRRLYQKVTESPDYSYYKFAILAGALGCSNIEAFLPEAIRAKHRNISFVTIQSPDHVAQYIASTLSLEAQNRFKSLDQNLKQSLVKQFNESVGSFLKKYGHSKWSLEFGVKSEDLRGPSIQASSIFPFYLAEQMQIEQDKLLFGMKPSDHFALVPLSDLASVNLRYLFEGRGIGIDNWSYNDIIGMYHVNLETMSLHPGGLTNLLIRSDQELNFKETSILPNLEPDDRSRIFRFGEHKNNQKVCSALQARSLKRLSRLTRPQIFNLSSNSSLAAKNWQHHFTNINKLPNLPVDLPTNPKSTKSCTQCHFGYIANYTGPELVRQSQSFPLALMTCANCHSDKLNKVAPYISFNNESELRQYAVSNPNFVAGIEYRLSDRAKGQLHHMPPVFRLKKADSDAILKFIRSL